MVLSVIGASSNNQSSNRRADTPSGFPFASENSQCRLSARFTDAAHCLNAVATWFSRAFDE
jgi:hypothetical protein